MNPPHSRGEGGEWREWEVELANCPLTSKSSRSSNLVPNYLQEPQYIHLLQTIYYLPYPLSNRINDIPPTPHSPDLIIFKNNTPKRDDEFAKFCPEWDMTRGEGCYITLEVVE